MLAQAFNLNTPEFKDSLVCSVRPRIAKAAQLHRETLSQGGGEVGGGRVVVAGEE